jgi:hypothetical protein
VILVIKGSRTKVDESNLGVKQHPTELCRAGICVGRRRDVAVICEGLVVVLHEENVLGFEIGVDEIEIMQDCKHESETDGQGLGAVGDKLTGDARKELASELLDVSARKGHKSVALEEVKDALAQEIGDDADVVAEVKRVSQVDTLVAVVLVVACQSRQDAQLDATSIAVFLHRADDLDGHVGVSPAVVCLYYLAERALAEELHYRVCRERVSATRDVSGQRRLTSLSQVSMVVDNVMSVVIVDLLVTLGRSLYHVSE